MKLRNINFPPVIGASGVQGFFSGYEYKYHKIFDNLIWGFDFEGMGFVGKTMTFESHKGNTQLASDGYSIKKFLPDSIWANHFKGVGLNSVGLSNPGAKFLLDQDIWQKRTDSFMLSFMAISKTPETRLEETRLFVETFKIYLSSFKGKVALQVNFSCPNVGHDQIGLLKEVAEILNILSRLDIPLVPKFNVLLSADSMSTIMKHEACDAICISNTLPFGERPDMVDWKRFFPNGSPLAKHKYGNGGLSGKPLFPLLMEWLTEAEKLRPQKPIIAGGGILKRSDVVQLSRFSSVKAISLGSVAFLRPWRIRKIIRAGYDYFGKR